MMELKLRTEKILNWLGALGDFAALQFRRPLIKKHTGDKKAT